MKEKNKFKTKKSIENIYINNAQLQSLQSLQSSHNYPNGSSGAQTTKFKNSSYLKHSNDSNPNSLERRQSENNSEQINIHSTIAQKVNNSRQSKQR